MVRIRGLALVLVLSAAGARAAAADEAVCLSAEARRAAVTSHRAMPLARAVHDLRSRMGGAEVVRARLCSHGQELVYVLTLLARDGKVTIASIDAQSGAMIEGR